VFLRRQKECALSREDRTTLADDELTVRKFSRVISVNQATELPDAIQWKRDQKMAHFNKNLLNFLYLIILFFLLISAN